MLTLVQNNSNPAPAKRRAGKPTTNVRGQTLRAIHATWRKIAPSGLDGDELRDARLAFATKALNLKKPLASIQKCSPAQLGRVLDAMRELEHTPSLPGVDAPLPIPRQPSPAEGAEIIHLATNAQVSAIERLRNYLGWTAIGLQNFMIDKFRGKHSAALLTPADANSCTMILLTIAARKRITGRGVTGKISRTLIHAEIPALKRELGIDQKPAEHPSPATNAFNGVK